jgi:P4 family phage/plasmid primase-like protien
MTTPTTDLPLAAEAGDAEVQSDIETALAFLNALFDPEAWILLRPIETWNEGGRKRSQVDHRNTAYRNLATARSTVQQLLRLSEQERLNLFFGVCPRLGTGGQYDLAWQIRTVRALWTDIDHVTVNEARERISQSGLPQPSIIVNSGNGVHLYWLLDQPYLIDDAGEPPPAFTEWTEGKDSKKRSRKYLQEKEGGERLYLDVRANVPELSPKAILIQDVIAGIASAIGGDHTHDLSRLLRWPGSWNRKDQRNGRPPVPCEMVACDANQKYPINVFTAFAESSPQKSRRKQIASVKLPSSKRLTPTKRDKLNALINACAAAAVGSRSQADWSLVCTAVEKGWPKSEVWQAVADTGKFAEGGEAYFERTWRKAEDHTREQQFEKAITGPHEYHQNVGITDEEGETRESDPGLVALLAKLICESARFAQDEGGKLYRYDNGVYCPRGEEFVKAQVKRLCGVLNQLADWSSHVAKEVIEFIRVDSPHLWDQPSVDVINVRNGLLNTATKELMAHTPDHLSAVQLKVMYDPTATCPTIDKFVGDVFPEDALNLAYEIPAWLMTPDTSIQKAVLLTGPGGNGKSRYLRMVEAFLGKTNVANLSLNRLEADKFACTRLYGKLANICSDLPTEHLAGTSIFKAITGGDTITGEYKFRDSFDFTPFARLVFSANSPPRAMDASEGFFDRWLVVPFERRFRGEGGEIPADKLDAMLSEPSEQSGLLNRALEALPRLRASGRFSEAVSLTRAFSEFRASTDPLSVWLDSQTVEGPKLVTTKRALISAYNHHCEQHGRSPASQQSFGASMKRLRPDVADAQRTVSGKVQWCYIGLGLKSDLPQGQQGDTALPDISEPHGLSHDSRASRDSPSINLSRKKKDEGYEQIIDHVNEQDRDDRVKRVNPVNDACLHEYVDEEVGDRIRTSCRLCGKFHGFRHNDFDRVNGSTVTDAF